jgi:hypothetical protein
MFRPGPFASSTLRPWVGAVWTEERKERSDWSDEGRPHLRGPGPCALLRTRNR